jgi:non-canonical purine NTP pyrophosphatase (RdgB/HAM1 family)
MPRKVYQTEPEVINKVFSISISSSNDKSSTNYLEVATTNKGKIKEIERILTDFVIKPVNLDVEEIQSKDPLKVVSEKAKAAFEANGYNPILVEDTSLEIRGLNGNPGTYVKDFCGDVDSRRTIAVEWLNGKDRTAVARVILGIYDGVEVHMWEGSVSGEISETLRGTNGFGWDDLFVPAEQPHGEKRTFAEMTDKEKDSYSMRKRALIKFRDDPFTPHYPIYMLPEPFEQELERVHIDELGNGIARRFAYALESIEGNRISSKFTANTYLPMVRTDNSYFTRFLTSENSNSIGLMLTDMDRKHLRLHKNGDPFLWQMGPERRHLALVQRTDFFNRNQNDEIHELLDELEQNIDQFPKRNNKRSITLEHALGIQDDSIFTQTMSLKEIGYKKLSSEKRTSRTQAASSGLFTKIGKYPRSIYAIGCLPWVSGWRDVIVTSAIAHMPVFVHRNNVNAIDFENQIKLIKDAKEVIRSLKLGAKREERAMRNIGAALGCDPEYDLEKAKRLYTEAGVKLFRIYTINSDPRVVETAHALRQHFGEDIEIFAGQLVDIKQCEALIAPEVRVDGFIFGHGGGRQCTSATNGMALTTLEELYSVLIEPKFNDTTVMIEGGIGTSVGGLIVMGVDGILRNAQFANCVIEQGDVYFEHVDGSFVQPYHGSASAAAMIIESYNPVLAKSRLYPSGRTKNVEGKSGYIYYSEKANSMTFSIDSFRHYAARTLADLGVLSIWELREFLNKNNEELLRIVSADAAYTASAWKR